MPRKSYPTDQDRFWMEPGSDIPCRIDPYSLLSVVEYGTSKPNAIYQCVCMRCGSLHKIRRSELQVLARSQRNRAKKQGSVWPTFSGHCPNCAETDLPTLTGSRFTLQKLNADGFSVLHSCHDSDGLFHARIGIYDPQGKVAEIRPRNGSPKPVILEETSPSSALQSLEEMFCRLLSKLRREEQTVVYSHTGAAVYLHAFCLPSGNRLR